MNDASVPVQDEKYVFKDPLHSIKTWHPEVNDTNPLPHSEFNLSSSHEYESLKNDCFLKPYSYESPSMIFEHDASSARRYDSLELGVTGSQLAVPLQQNLTPTKREYKPGEPQSRVMGPEVTLESVSNVETDGRLTEDGGGEDKTETDEPQGVSHPYATLEPFDISTLEDSS